MLSQTEQLAKLVKALVTLDMDYARQVVPEATSDLVRLVAMHKARYEHIGVPEVYRHISRKWLEDHGFKRHKGIPWPPEGELPE